MKSRKSFVVSGVFALLALILIILVKNVDVAVVPETGKPMGFYSINTAFHNIFGINIIWYRITEIFGILALLVCAVFALIGLLQLIKRKSITEVDPVIIKLGCLYAVVIALYALFEKVIINYRPIIMPDATEAEASFPSSHTMLICVVMASTIMVIGNYIKDEKLLKLLKICCAVIMVVTVVGRLICGVHWLTDILGGILISSALLFLFKGIADKDLR
ncbi:phosphatase PAP2 family protein [Butyrivibrio sp. AD3002]|uniref:phosphatase PAP2 family protein n=1 Tax=Butyrivibrio sp. AD3002 TaxID=1280670 RepID=UPI0003B707E0|nr:phosphatase PAP2 family protein [Butyrivibrio sp. AD3002]